jgi:hypothetical protein
MGKQAVNYVHARRLNSIRAKNVLGATNTTAEGNGGFSSRPKPLQNPLPAVPG